MRARRATLGLVATRPRVTRVLGLTGVDSLLPTYRSLSEAMRELAALT